VFQLQGDHTLQKVYAGVLDRRVRQIVDPPIQGGKCGFISGHGTLDQIFTFARIL